MSSATKSQAKFEHPLFQEGIAYEQARIVELLDVLATQEPPFAQMLINNLKVLIKGENK